MHFPPIHQQSASSALVRDLNENGRVDEVDARIDLLAGSAPELATRGGLVDVRG